MIDDIALSSICHKEYKGHVSVTIVREKPTNGTEWQIACRARLPACKNMRDRLDDSSGVHARWHRRHRPIMSTYVIRPRVSYPF